MIRNSVYTFDCLPLYIRMEDEDYSINKLSVEKVFKYSNKSGVMPKAMRYRSIYITKKVYIKFGEQWLNEIVKPMLADHESTLSII